MKCDDCGHDIQIGEWPFCNHGRPTPSKGFEPYWDENIATEPVWISDPGDRNQRMRPHWENDHMVHVQPRERPDSYFKDLAERREERRKHATK